MKFADDKDTARGMNEKNEEKGEETKRCKRCSKSIQESTKARGQESLSSGIWQAYHVREHFDTKDQRPTQKQSLMWIVWLTQTVRDDSVAKRRAHIRCTATAVLLQFPVFTSCSMLISWMQRLFSFRWTVLKPWKKRVRPVYRKKLAEKNLTEIFSIRIFTKNLVLSC